MSSISNTQRIGWTSAMIALFVSAVWGGNVVAVKVGLTSFPPLWSAFWRFVVAVVTVALWARATGIRLTPEPGEARSFGILSMLFAVQITGMNTGVNFTSPAYAVILLNAYPIFTNIIGHFVVLEDRLSRPRVFGLAIAFTGICYLALGRPDQSLAPHPILGNMIVLVSACLLAARMVYTQRLVQTMEPTRTVFWQMLFSVPMFLAAAIVFEPLTVQPVEWKPVLALVYQGVAVGGFCFVAWTHLLRRHSPGSLSVFSFSVPLFGVILSAYLFNEAITARLVFGIVAVMAGIIIVTRYQRPSHSERPSPALEEVIEEMSR